MMNLENYKGKELPFIITIIILEIESFLDGLIFGILVA